MTRRAPLGARDDGGLHGHGARRGRPSSRPATAAAVQHTTPRTPHLGQRPRCLSAPRPDIAQRGRRGASTPPAAPPDLDVARVAGPDRLGEGLRLRTAALVDDFERDGVHYGPGTPSRLVRRLFGHVSGLAQAADDADEIEAQARSTMVAAPVGASPRAAAACAAAPVTLPGTATGSAAGGATVCVRTSVSGGPRRDGVAGSRRQPDAHSVAMKVAIGGGSPRRHPLVRISSSPCRSRPSQFRQGSTKPSGGHPAAAYANGGGARLAPRRPPSCAVRVVLSARARARRSRRRPSAPQASSRPGCTHARPRERTYRARAARSVIMTSPPGCVGWAPLTAMISRACCGLSIHVQGVGRLSLNGCLLPISWKNGELKASSRLTSWMLSWRST